MSTDYNTPKSPSQVSSTAPSRSVVFGDNQRQSRSNIRFAPSSGATQNRVTFGHMGNTSSQQRQIPMMRSESEIPHKFLEDQIEERSRNRTWPNHQSSLSVPYNQPDINSNTTSSINLSAKPQKTATSAISKTHRKIVSLGGLSKNSTASSTTNGVAIQQLSSATISGSGKPNNKLKVSIILNKPFYTAGTELTGFIELTSLTKENLGIADITLELTGYEGGELIDRLKFDIVEFFIYLNSIKELEPAAAPNIAGLSKPSQFGGQLASPTKTFYRTRLLLQDHEHPCSAVQDVAYPDAEGFWPCRKGKTSLPFLLRLAPTLPNAIITSQGKVSYYLEAIIQLKSGIFKEVANFGRRVTILERWEPAEVSAYRGRGVKGETRKRLFMGGPRHLELESELVTSLVAAGSMAYIRITVRNLTTKKVQGVRLTLLQTAGAHEGLGPNVGAEAPTRPAVEKILKDADLKFSPGEERSCLVAMEIPMHCLSLRHTVLLKVSYTLQVALISSLSKDLTVDLPVYISHPSSWSDPCPSIERVSEALPETETEPFTKDQNEDGRLYSGNSSPPMLSLPEVRKKWGDSTHSQSAENVGSERNGMVVEEQGSISEGASPLHSPKDAPAAALFSASNTTSPNINASQPTRPSFFRRQSPVNRPSSPSEASANEIYVGGRRYHLADSFTPSAPEASIRPHTVVDEYQIRSRPSNVPVPFQSRHSSYVSNEQREETYSSVETQDDGNRICLDKNSLEPFVNLHNDFKRGSRDLDSEVMSPLSDTFSQGKIQPIQQDEQYQWSSANKTSAQTVSHHTPEQDLSRRSTRIAIKRKSSTKVRTRSRRAPSPKPKQSTLLHPTSPNPKQPTLLHPPSPLPENAQVGQEGMEAQLALLQKQMALLMASLQPKSPPAAPLSPPKEKMSQPQSPIRPDIPEPTTEDNPLDAKPIVSQKLPKKSKKSQPLRNLHQYRAAFKSQNSTAEEHDWI